MGTRQENTYVQCLNCGRVHRIERKISMNIAVIESECPYCEWSKGLNCGYSEMDLMELKDFSLDERYFNY